MKINNKPRSNKETPVKFTEWQKAIVRAWAQYPSIAQAAEQLNITENTFQTHLRRMRRKINATRTFDVYHYMKENHLL